jgi:hypothetical protein
VRAEASMALFGLVSRGEEIMLHTCSGASPVAKGNMALSSLGLSTLSLCSPKSWWCSFMPQPYTFPSAITRCG